MDLRKLLDFTSRKLQFLEPNAGRMNPEELNFLRGSSSGSNREVAASFDLGGGDDGSHF